MDPATINTIEHIVTDYIAQTGADVPGWLKAVLSIMGVQLTAISAKLGFDIYQYQIKKPDFESPRIIQTPTGEIPERRKWDAHRCEEHLTRIAGVEAALHKVEPELTRFEERFSAYVARLERGDNRFDGLTKAIESLNTNTAVLTKQVERLEQTIDRNGNK
jgi:hypothetical protein